MAKYSKYLEQEKILATDNSTQLPMTAAISVISGGPKAAVQRMGTHHFLSFSYQNCIKYSLAAVGRAYERLVTYRLTTNLIAS